MLPQSMFASRGGRQLSAVTVRVATWNLEWAPARHHSQIAERISAFNSDILILTETTLAAIPEPGHWIDGGSDWGYPINPERRKVVLWSRWPIEPISAIQEPGGRHAVGRVVTPVGALVVHGVCVPWSRAHVSNGGRNRQPWQDHMTFLDALDASLGAVPGTVIVAGDINQRTGARSRTSALARDRWTKVLDRHRLTVVTDDTVLDKIAVGADLTASKSTVIPHDGLSDHDAVAAIVGASDAQTREDH